VCVCVYHCVQLSYTTQHRTVLITFPLILQTIIIAQMLTTTLEGIPSFELHHFRGAEFYCSHALPMDHEDYARVLLNGVIVTVYTVSVPCPKSETHMQLITERIRTVMKYDVRPNRRVFQLIVEIEAAHGLLRPTVIIQRSAAKHQ